jgi:hypothetical protein
VPPATPIEEGIPIQSRTERSAETDPPGFNGQQGGPNGARRPWLRKVVLALAILGVVALAGAGYLLFTSEGGGLRIGGPKVVPRTPFAFGEPTIKLTPIVGSPSFSSVADEADKIRIRLGEFYDLAFMEPDTWEKGLPADIWKGFTKDAAAKAAADPTALTLGRQPRLRSLDVESSSLALNVLFDGKKRPTVIVAGVAFRATGSLTDDSTVIVKSDAQFLLRLVSGRWMVSGFPSAKVEIDSEAPSPEPTATVGSPESSP